MCPGWMCLGADVLTSRCLLRKPVFDNRFAGPILPFVVTPMMCGHLMVSDAVSSILDDRTPWPRWSDEQEAGNGDRCWHLQGVSRICLLGRGARHS